jgi:hypothetical protein
MTALLVLAQAAVEAILTSRRLVPARCEPRGGPAVIETVHIRHPQTHFLQHPYWTSVRCGRAHARQYGWPVRRSGGGLDLSARPQTGASIDEFSRDVEVAGMSRGLLDHV